MYPFAIKIVLPVLNSTDPGPRAIGLDADDRFLLAPDTRTGYLNVYSIDLDTGKLGLLDRYPLDKNPSKATSMWVLATKP